MASHSDAPYYRLDISAEQWTPALSLASANWMAQDPYDAVLPAEVTFKAGVDPSYATFIIKAAPYSGGKAFPAIASTTLASQRLPDGTTGTMTVPAINDGGGALTPLKPWMLARFVEVGGSDTVRFVGIVMGFTLDISKEEWRIECVELPRWYLTKIVYKGFLYLGADEADPDDCRLIPDGLACHNNDGTADEYAEQEGGEAPLQFFTQADVVSVDGLPAIDSELSGYGTYWTLGMVLNHLREMFVIRAAALGLPDISTFVNWPKCGSGGGEKWSFLITSIEYDTHSLDLALGGLTLAECIEAIVRRAGHYEWKFEWNQTTSKYDLRIWDKNTGDNEAYATVLPLTRGTLNTNVSTVVEPSVHAGVLSWNYSNAITKGYAFGNKKLWETTIGYGSIIGQGTSEEVVLTPCWTPDEQTDYQAKEIDGYPEVDRLYPDVFRRFKIEDESDWTSILGVNTGGGPRKILKDLLSIDASNNATRRQLQLRVFRWTGSAFEEAPDSVHVQILEDMSILVSGYDKQDTSIEYDPQGGGTETREKQPRWLCDNTGETWEARPFRVTLVVEDDNHALGEAEDKPADWPDLFGGFRTPRIEHNTRKNALHGVDDEANPVSGNYTALTYLSGPTIMKDGEAKLDKMAARYVAALAKPVLAGELSLPDYQWYIVPGVIITQLTGGGGLPTVAVIGHITEVSFFGLAVEDQAQQRMQIKLENQ